MIRYQISRNGLQMDASLCHWNAPKGLYLRVLSPLRLFASTRINTQALPFNMNKIQFIQSSIFHSNIVLTSKQNILAYKSDK